jgi:hypothetical protein
MVGQVIADLSLGLLSLCGVVLWVPILINVLVTLDIIQNILFVHHFTTDN